MLKEQKHLEYIDSILMSRKVYAHAIAKGIIELKRRDYVAIKELKKLYMMVK